MMTETLSMWTPATRVPFVYGLVDPIEPKHVRYVGMAAGSAKRPLSHAYVARKTTTKTSYLVNWVRKLQSEGREPSILILEQLSESVPRDLVGFVEKSYIKSLREIGHRLTNVTPGGDGFHGKHTTETLALMHLSKLGNQMSAEARAKSSAAQKGKANRGCGKPHTEKHKAWIKARQEKLYEDDANREVQRAAQEKAWADPVKRAAHSVLMKASWARRKAGLI